MSLGTAPDGSTIRHRVANLGSSPWQPTLTARSFFPAIEKKYGQPMSYWFDQMEQVADRKYPEQIAFLKENHGFSQAHANALVMYSRGVHERAAGQDTLEEYLKPIRRDQEKDGPRHLHGPHVEVSQGGDRDRLEPADAESSTASTSSECPCSPTTS